jgi:hypothetical protein
MRLAAWSMALTASVGLLGCYDLAEPPLTDESLVNACVENEDCSRGTCWSGVCSIGETRFSALLLELTPPATIERFRGTRIYHTLTLDDDVPSEHTVRVKYPRTVRGDIGLGFGAADCRPSPVRVSFVPVEAHLGLEVPRYTTVSEVGTAIVNKRHVDTHRYSLSGVPEGVYDVYLEDAELVDNSSRPECAVAPQSIRALRIASDEGASTYVRNLVQTQVRTLLVEVLGNSPFVGWEVDVIHPVTWERLSSRAVFATGEDPSTPVSVSLRLSQVSGQDIVGSNRELLRLSPPAHITAPTITMALVGVEAWESGKAQIPALGDLPDPVNYQVWVWRTPNGGGVQGKVHFRSLALEGISPGISTTFERRANIGEGGLVEVKLPPGQYAVRVMPDVQTRLAHHETEVTVWLPSGQGGGRGNNQAGHVIVVPSEASAMGRVRFGNQSGPVGTQVVARALDTWPSQRASSFQWLPTASALVNGDRFQVRGLTCRACDDENPGAMYAFFVRPPEPSGFPWVISIGERIGATQVMLPNFGLELPRVVSGSLRVETNVGSGALPRFSVRAYGLMDKHGQPLAVADLPRCQQLSASDLETLPNCTAEALEVAFTQSGDDGNFRLLLPSGLTIREPIDAGL